MDRAHVRVENKKILKSERCDRNSLCFFLSFVPFYILFIVHTLNWLHFWHWEKAASNTRKRKKATKKEKKRKRIPQSEITRQFGDRVHIDSTCFLLQHFVLDAHFGRDWSWIDKRKNLITLDGLVMKWFFAKTETLFFRRLTQAASLHSTSSAWSRNKIIVCKIHNSWTTSIVNEATKEKPNLKCGAFRNFIHQRALILINENVGDERQCVIWVPWNAISAFYCFLLIACFFILFCLAWNSTHRNRMKLKPFCGARHRRHDLQASRLNVTQLFCDGQGWLRFILLPLPCLLTRVLVAEHKSRTEHDVSS